MRAILGAFFLVVGFSSQALASEAADHTGVNMAANLGAQDMLGRFSEDDVEPGVAFKLDLGWRITPRFSLESGLAFATGKTDGLAVRCFYLPNLDARFFPLGARKIEPNALVGFTHYSAASIEGPDEVVTYLGYSPTLGAGTRFHVSDRIYIQGDFRYLYTRFTDVVVDAEGEANTAPLARQEHGDTFMVLFGAGLQF